jgi:hypothetical protein
VKPAEELVSEQNPAKYKTFNFGKYMVISFVVILANKRLKLTEFLTLNFKLAIKNVYLLKTRCKHF